MAKTDLPILVAGGGIGGLAAALALARKVRLQELDEDFDYDPNQLDREVVAVDQIRTIVRIFRDKLATEIVSGDTEVPKTLVFAKDIAYGSNSGTLPL